MRTSNIRKQVAKSAPSSPSGAAMVKRVPRQPAAKQSDSLSGEPPVPLRRASDLLNIGSTDRVVKKLREQGIVKPVLHEIKTGGAGHRTKDRRPVQINMTEVMYKQLKIISATHGVSVTDQIIAALEAQGYKT